MLDVLTELLLLPGSQDPVDHHHDQPDEDEGHPHPKQLAPVGLGDGGGNHGGEDHEEAKEDEDDPRVERRLTGVGLVHRQRNIFICFFLETIFFSGDSILFKNTSCLRSNS